jgi:hypothetical protein
MTLKLEPADLDLIEVGLSQNNRFRLVSGVRGHSVDLEAQELQTLLSRGLPQETIEILAEKISDWGGRPWHSIWRRGPWNPFESTVG